jgi:ABC-type transport system involved in cytochrome c biogenesis ATPase subunit
MTYETQWKPDVDQLWEEYKVAWIRDNPEQPLDKTQFKFMASFMREKYENETPEVKTKVEEYHQTVTKSPTEINQSFQE